jgi:hypothetical protein
MTIDDAHHPRNSKSRHRHRNSKSRHRHRDGRAHSGRSMTIPQFCKLHRIGRSTYYELQRKGLGPVVMQHLGRIVRISAEANRDWIKKMESDITSPVPPLDAVQPELSEETDAVESRKRRTKLRKTRKHQHGNHRRHHRDE